MGERQAGEGGSEQEEAAEGGAEGAGAEVELAAVGLRGEVGAGGLVAFLGGAAGQFAEAGLAEEAQDGLGAEGAALAAEAAFDVGDGEVLILAEGEDAAGAVVGGRCLLGLEGAWAGRGDGEEGAVGLAAEGGEEIVEGTAGIAEAGGGFGWGQAVDEVSAEGLVLAVGGIGGLEEAGGEGVHGNGTC